MKLVTLTLGSLLFLFSSSQSQLTQPLQGTLSSALNNLLSSSNQPQEFCTNKSSASSAIPSCSLAYDGLAGGLEAPGSEIHPNNSVFPSWMNLTLARRGQSFANNYLISTIMSHGFGLIYTIAAPFQFSNILISTHKSDTGERATYRYFATLTQVLNWYQGDLSDITNTAVSTSLRKVRDIHLSVVQKATSTLNQGLPLVPDSYYDNITFNTRLWDAFYKDLNNSDIPQQYRIFRADGLAILQNYSLVPISQVQQSLTQFAFVGLPVLFPDRVGIGHDATDDDILAFNHLWAVLGYGLGIQDDYNIALQPNLTATRQYYQNLLNTYFLPMLFNSNQNSTKVLGEAVFKAFEDYTTQYGLTTNTFMYLFLKRIINIPAPNVYALFSDEEKASEALIESTFLPLLTSNPAYRATANTAANTAFQYLMAKYFGPNHTSLQSRAEDVYYA